LLRCPWLTVFNDIAASSSRTPSKPHARDPS
jgi:hypothetical protein